MTKDELIATVALNANTTKSNARKVIDGLVDAIHVNLQSGDKVKINGLGTIQIKHRKERQGRNPKTGDAMVIPAKYVPVMTFAGQVKDKLNDNS